MKEKSSWPLVVVANRGEWKPGHHADEGRSGAMDTKVGGAQLASSSRVEPRESSRPYTV